MAATRNFFRNEKILFLAKVIEHFQIAKIQIIKLHCACELKSRFPENQLQNLSSLTVFEMNA